MFFKPGKFVLQELLPEEFYNEQFPVYGDLLWNCFDYRALFVLDKLRERYGPAIMNTWFNPNMKARYGNHQWRGLRDSTSPYVSGRTQYGNISQHRYGRAMDVVFLNHSAEEVRQDILTDPNNDDFKYITCIEEGVAWLHFDTRNWNKTENGVKVVRP